MFPFNDYKTIFFGPINGNGTVVYTTTSLCMVYFVPYGPYMEDDSPIGLYVDNYFTDSDGGQADNYIYYSKAVTRSPLNLNVPQSDISTSSFGTSNSVIVPSGKNIKAFIGDSSDKIGGTLYVFGLPN